MQGTPVAARTCWEDLVSQGQSQDLQASERDPGTSLSAGAEHFCSHRDVDLSTFWVLLALQDRCPEPGLRAVVAGESVLQPSPSS